MTTKIKVPAIRASVLKRFKGAALIILMMLIAIVTITLVTSSLSHSQTQLNRDKKTTAAFAMAKEALLAYAASDANSDPTSAAIRPGELPCPDWDGDGQLTLSIDYGSSGSCTTYTGYLPWKSLRLPDIRDGNGERLWYSVSQNFRAGNSVPLNTDTLGQITITGSSPANNVIAIIISPGQILAGKVQDSTYQNQAVLTNPANYLEGSNATGDTNTDFETATASTTFNDQILSITHHDLFQAVTVRIAGEIKNMPPPSAPNTSPLQTSSAAWASVWEPVTFYSLSSGGGMGGSGMGGGSSTTATVTFSNCNITFTINQDSSGNSITRSGTC